MQERVNFGSLGGTALKMLTLDNALTYGEGRDILLAEQNEFSRVQDFSVQKLSETQFRFFLVVETGEGPDALVRLLKYDLSISSELGVIIMAQDRAHGLFFDSGSAISELRMLDKGILLVGCSSCDGGDGLLDFVDARDLSLLHRVAGRGTSEQRLGKAVGSPVAVRNTVRNTQLVWFSSQLGYELVAHAVLVMKSPSSGTVTFKDYLRRFAVTTAVAEGNADFLRFAVVDDDLFFKSDAATGLLSVKACDFDSRYVDGGYLLRRCEFCTASLVYTEGFLNNRCYSCADMWSQFSLDQPQHAYFYESICKPKPIAPTPSSDNGSGEEPQGKEENSDEESPKKVIQFTELPPMEEKEKDDFPLYVFLGTLLPIVCLYAIVTSCYRGKRKERIEAETLRRIAARMATSQSSRLATDGPMLAELQKEISPSKISTFSPDGKKQIFETATEMPPLSKHISEP